MLILLAGVINLCIFSVTYLVRFRIVYKHTIVRDSKCAKYIFYLNDASNGIDTRINILRFRVFYRG